MSLYFRKNWYLAALFLLLVKGESCSDAYDISIKYPPEFRSVLKQKPLKLGYDSIREEVVYKNLNMPGVVKRSGVYGKRTYGMLIRCMRFENITKAAEKKYGLPEHMLLAMIMQESGGADLLPNSGDDGGLGLIHMQPSVAKRFGLKIYQNCDKLVSKKHGKALRALIKKYAFDKKKLIKYDDRFHPILNIDAAARMIAFYAGGKQYKDSPFETAIFRYAGSKNYKKYSANLKLFMNRLGNKKLRREACNYFNEINPELKINDKKANCKKYIKSHQKQNENYGLKEYKQSKSKKPFKKPN